MYVRCFTREIQEPDLPVLPVVIPLLLAALLASLGSLAPRRLLDLVALLAAAAVSVICCLLMLQSTHGVIVYWLGDWHPAAVNHYFPVGICFMIDPIGAGMAALVAALVTAAFAFSWSYFESVKSLYHALMLVFLAAMCGLCLTGDLFNLFVWFELMTATAVGLCGYKSEESWPLLGALNFAVTNTVGAFLTLTGIAILYAYTGSLNMAEVSRSLAAHPPGAGFETVALLLVVTGFLVKAAAFPFHFWLADAHAVAPTPVCVLFSGVMVELGIYAIARIIWLVFAPVFAPEMHALRFLLLIVGSLTAVIGAIHCFGQRHLKRLLAFSTVSHVGLMIIGLALLDPRALAGLAMYVVGHGLVKGSLFICAGIFLHRFHSVDEHDLRGQGKKIIPIGIVMFLGALGLMGLPPFATFYGQGLIEKAADEQHRQWVTYVALWAEALTAGAVLRATGRIFLGWGPIREATSRGSPHIPMNRETKGNKFGTPVWMWLPPMLMIIAALAVAAPGRCRLLTERAATVFETPAAYQSSVLDAKRSGSLSEQAPANAESVEISWHQVVAFFGAIAVALGALFPQFLGKHFARLSGRALLQIMEPLRKIQTGRIGDYIAWLVLGVATYGGLLLLFERIL